MTRRRVLVIAEAANPEWVSVPLVGWSMATALRDVADVHIVTQVRNRDAFLRAGLQEGRDFTAIDSERIERLGWKLATKLRGGEGKGWTMVSAIASFTYPYFEHLVWREFEAQLRQGAFDIVHRVTPLSPVIGGPMARRCAKIGVPFVIGPLNGGVPWPKQFAQARRREREWLSYVRKAYKLLPGRSASFRAARTIIAGSRHTASELPAAVHGRTVYLPENGIDPARFNIVSQHSRSGPLRICFIGRLVPYKGPDMAIEAAAPLIRAGKAVLDIIGDGPARADLQALSVALGIESGVSFRGWVPHQEVQGLATRSQIFLFPSIREFGGGVVLEAMAMGLLPMIVDYGGPGELVTAERGIKVPIGSRESIVAALSAALESLERDRGEIAAKSFVARKWALTAATWSARARHVAEIYEWSLGAGPRPTEI